MKKINKKLYWSAACMALLITFMTALSCRKLAVVDNTTTDVNITGYIENHPENFSEFEKVIKISKTSGFLQAYGAYTLFAPTNDAIAKYLQEINVSSVEQLGEAKLKDLVYLHLVEDSIRTTDFTDGKLRSVTMLGQYIVTGASNVGGASKITINDQANLVTGNIKVGNGIIHMIDHVLKPATLTVAQTLEANPKFSIFTQALKETGYYDRINILPKQNPVTNESHMTVLAETDSVLAAAGFDTYAKLKARYSTTGNPKDPADSLNLYVAYHLVPQAYYYADFFNVTTISTLAVPGINTSLNNQNTVVINELEINGEIEKGAPVGKAESDVTASNGVVQTVKAHYRIIKRTPQPVYYDVADQPEFRRLPAWRTGAAQWSVDKPPLSRIKFNKNLLQYLGNWTSRNVSNKDVLNIPLGLPSRAPYFDFITPFVAAGKYKLWLCYPYVNRDAPITVYFNGEKLSRIMNYDSPAGLNALTDEQREQLGWKRYMMPIDYSMDLSSARSMGIVEVKKDGPQTIRMEIASGWYHNDYFLDMIQLIPEGMDQLWPRFTVDGQIVPRP